MTKVLVIEDEPIVRNLILKFLQAEGFDVVSAANGLSGLQIAQTEEPDLIICDVMMPGCDGYEVLQCLQQDPATACIPFIFLSARSDKTDLRQGMDLGADDYLTKPFRRNELLSAVTARLAKQSTITQPYINEMKRAAQSLGQLAYRDPLTNLPNRILLHHLLRDALLQAKQQKQEIAVLCLNLDRFKTVNQNFGQSVGDALLQAVAERLNRALGQENIVARLGGDEFCILLKEANYRSDITNTVQTILQLLEEEAYSIDTHQIQLKTSIGIALYPEHSQSIEQLLNKAEAAMRNAKKSGTDSYCIYSSDLDLLVTERQCIELSLGKALERNELQLYYQPQVNLISGRIIGVEVLLRWQHPKLGMISPQKFIPIAEETGLIVPIGNWVIRTACAQAKIWQTLNPTKVRVSVNLSARQFNQRNLIQYIDRVLQETGLEPGILVIELTETSIMEDVEATIEVLQSLKALGIQLAVDDFGTGYSSLNYLKRFPIDTLKIDRSFVDDVVSDAHGAAIAKAIIALAQSLQLNVIAEGVETVEQLNFLKQTGCHAMQGFLFSPPIAAPELEHFLVKNRRLYE